MKHLLELLRGQAINCTTDDAEWETVLTLAEEEHVLPWVAARLRSHEASLTPTISGRVRAVERDAAIAAFYWSSELKGLLRAFDQENLRVIPLKGPFLAERLYGGTALRACQDLDLLVSKRDLARAEAVLTAIGFAPGTPDDYHRQWYRGTTTVELHHDVVNPLAFNFDIEGALHQARPAVFEGQRCLQLRPEDELVFLCLHAVRHRYERLSLVLDLTLAFEGLVVPGDEWLPRPALAKLDILMVLGLAMARRLQPNLEMSAPVHTSPQQVRHLEALADRLWNQLLTQQNVPLDWSKVYAFYVEMELPGRVRLGRRLRHLRILSGRAIDLDTIFAAKLGLHREWQVWMLRPVRLLKELVLPRPPQS